MSRLRSRLQLAGLCLSASLRHWFNRNRPRPAEAQRILIAHHLLLGDTLMLAPLLAKLRQNNPQAQIVMTCPTAIMPLFAARPYGVEAVAYDPKNAATLRALAAVAGKRGFDLAILPADARLSWLARALRSRHIVGFAGDRPAYKNWLLDELRPWPATPTALADTFALLADGAAPADYQASDWPLATPAAFDVPTGRYAVLHLGASSSLKLWAAENWTALANRLAQQGITPIWSAGARETSLVAAADPDGRYRSLAGQLDLLQLAHVIKNAVLLVCPDTGVAHLGRLVAAPTLCLFGPGSALLCGKGDFWRHSAYVALSESIACRNQHTLFKREIAWVQRCARPLGTTPNACTQARCMQALSLDAVATAAQSLLNAPKPAP